jgi:hypothetical protein
MKAYANEIKYSHLEDLRSTSTVSRYEADDPDSAFEYGVQADLATARQAHLNDQFGPAIRRYSQLQALILKTAHPTLLVQIVSHPLWEVAYEPAAFAAFIAMAAESASRIRPPVTAVPPGMVWPSTVDPRALLARRALLHAGPGSSLDGVHAILVQAATAVSEGDFKAAVDAYTEAVRTAGDGDVELSAQLHQDLGLLLERSGEVDVAQAHLKTAQRLFTDAGSADGQVSALSALAGLLNRQGNSEGARGVLAEATDISRKFGVYDLEIAPTRTATGSALSSTILDRRINVGRIGGIGGNGVARPRADVGRSAAASILPDPSSQTGAPTLQALAYVSEKRAADLFTVISDQDGAPQISLSGDKAANLTALYKTMKVTTDLSLLHIQAVPAPTLVAYLPYIYFFIIPMSLGDCYLASGDYTLAQAAFLDALKYPYLNETVEVVQVWTRLAQTYVAWGDAAYRAAGDQAASWPDAAAIYGKVIGADGAIPANSPLYGDPRFAGLRARAAAIAAAADPTSVEDNSAVALPLTKARLRLSQIAAGQNFLGFTPDYLPPFSFESLQTSARYLAEHAGTMEQAYIQFKSQAESEEFREDQMNQQVELAAASLRLEADGVAQAQAGVQVAQRSLDYATTQWTNAKDAATKFASVRWELEELTQLDAWAQASAVDHDDEVKLTISGYDSFSADHEPRNTVLQRLAARRASLTDGLEQDRLNREVAAAKSYQAVAQAQVAQAQAGVTVAQQRVAVAGLQLRQAQDSREFLSLREFSSRHWYDMAQVMKGLAVIISTWRPARAG